MVYMKKIIAFFFVFLHFGLGSCGTASYHAENSVDWAGIYSGTVPGANSAIYVEITLNRDYTYSLTYQCIVTIISAVAGTGAPFSAAAGTGAASAAIMV